ncbi:Enoyl-[acyl-carrier-protein] reductase [NADH] [Tistlia consotensis]|uniref:Enoyl-[acyl-carrier-protein] reductase [NADH] n=1 Tax=Tistlia consotensis USBA 355 TaxID=560819 RepID=A0A1Y6CUI1_9PROT|nr:enoyl-ACP reductase FabI [Tistlia consotensis]SMF78075.1 Enoyl-[acyl-carrier-protein] reductase [NADH] [Tistlia consotensis USBA 355]SNS17712.1 Enoyl-[acyl-carrier-protein] reductase [NADH] [Tistlia consotensis]
MALFSLDGKRGLVVGVANEHSIGWGCAAALRAQGAEVALTYLNDRAKPWVAPLAERLEAPLLLPCDVREPGQLEAAFDAVARAWGRLDFLVHSIAYAPKEDLHGRLVDSSRDGFALAMDVSCHSFLRMAKLAEPLMTAPGPSGAPAGGTLLTVSFYGAEKVVEHYNLMGPVKAALEASVRYLAAELGPQNIRVHALSPGPLLTRAASGLDRFDELLDRARRHSPEGRLVTIEEIGALAAYLCSDAARSLTGETVHVDAGYHVVG